MQNERNIFYGGEVRQEEYDLLQALREKDFELENTGDFAVLQGTNIKWMFKTSDNEELFLVFDDSLKQNASRETFDFVLKKRAHRYVSTRPFRERSLH